MAITSWHTLMVVNALVLINAAMYGATKIGNGYRVTVLPAQK
jgi:hypothetical protein